MTSIELKDKIVQFLNDKKGQDIAEIEVGTKTTVADWFVLASGTSKVQVKALADFVEEQLEADNLRPLHTDGREGGSWLILDYGNVMVHVFDRETREAFQLEKLWKEER